jgi:Ca2+-binding RTX toxin-like protein
MAFSPDTNVVGDGITNAKVLTLTGTATANSTVQVFDGTTQLGNAAANASGAWSFTTDTLSDGSHSFIAMDTDAAGNVSAVSSVLNVTVDTQPPAAPAINSESLVNGTAVLLIGTAAANSTVTVFDGTTSLGTTTTASNGNWNFTAGNVSNVVHAYTATATDVAGNIGPSSNEAILGSTNADTLVGRSGNDIINGNGGNDTIIGGLGADTLTGGSGKVTFAYNSSADSTPRSQDTITDFWCHPG